MSIRPVYIIAAGVAVEDKDSSIAAYANVLETIETTYVPGREPAPAPFPFTVSTAWFVQDPGEGFECEHEFWFNFTHDDPSNQPRRDRVASSRFMLSNQRMKVSLKLYPGVAFKNPGLFVIEGRIRKVGDHDWVTQEYPITVRLKELPQDSADKSNSLPAPG